MSRAKKVLQDLGMSSLSQLAHDPERGMAAIQRLYQNAFTQRNIVTDVLSFFKNNPSHQSTGGHYDRWKKFHASLTQQSQTTLSEQKAQALALWQEQQPIYKMMAAQMKDPHKSLSSSVRYLALLLSQYVQIQYIMDARYLVDVSIIPDRACIVLKGERANLFCQGQKHLLNKQVTLAIQRSIKLFPRQYVFVQDNLKPFTKTNKLMDLLKIPVL